jgi:hypothetical protein
VNVNETRSDDVSCGINDPLCWTSEAPGESSDPPVAYGDIGNTAWGTTAIDDLGTTNNEVVHRLSPLASHAALCWWRGDVAASPCEVPIATATVLYGSAQGKGTQHARHARVASGSEVLAARVATIPTCDGIHQVLAEAIMPVLRNDTNCEGSYPQLSS